MNPSEFFRRMAERFPELERQVVCDVVAMKAERFHAENFRNEGFTDVALEKWPARKKADKMKVRRALLVKTGTLKGQALKGRTRKGAVEFVFPWNTSRYTMRACTHTFLVTLMKTSNFLKGIIFACRRVKLFF